MAISIYAPTDWGSVLSADKWLLTASRNTVGCLVEPEDSEHGSEEAARAAWAAMDPNDYMDAFIFPTIVNRRQTNHPETPRRLLTIPALTAQGKKALRAGMRQGFCYQK